MGWQVGFDSDWRRWIGYGVPATCDHPHCDAAIDRGLAYRCGEPSDDDGCGLFFCVTHGGGSLCPQCEADADPFTPSPDTAEWVTFMMTDDSWAQWRLENAETVKLMRMRLGAAQ